MIHAFRNKGQRSWMITPCIGVCIPMEIYTGSGVSFMGQSYKHYLYRSVPLISKPSLERVPILGQCDVLVKHNNQEVQLTLLVMEGDGPRLFGYNWLNTFQID